MSQEQELPVKRVKFTPEERAQLELAHFTYDEVHSMTVMQRVEIVEDLTNIPAFPLLEEVFQEPEIRELFVNIRETVEENGGRIPEALNAACNKIRREEQGFKELTPSRKEDRITKALGTNGDTQIALVPSSVLAFFDSIRGERKINPQDGLPMYFWPAVFGAALTLGGMFLSRRETNKRYKEAKRDRQEAMDFERKQIQQEKDELEAEKEAAGWNRGFTNEQERAQVPGEFVIGGKQMRNNPMQPNKDDHEGMTIEEKLQKLEEQLHSGQRRQSNFKTGGHVGKPIKGRGNGQSDDIPVDSTREGEWIWDASTVSDLGDGSTDAGWKEIRKLEKRVASLPGFKDLHVFKPGVAPQKVKTALSNGEYRTPTKIVTAIGMGDNGKGADVLRTMTEEIRRHKNSNGDKLPPPIKDPLQFFEKARKAKLGGRLS